MDREEQALYSAMLTDKTHAPGQENNVNITNLFGSTLVGGDKASNIAGVWATYKCAIGQYTNPLAGSGNECGNVNPPLDPASALPACQSGNTCADQKQVCISAPSYESGKISRCATPCDYKQFPATGCQSPAQACVASGTVAGCMDMKMDRNGATSKNGHPLLWHYPGAWTRTPFTRGHSPITIGAADKRPGNGVAKIHIPNFANGPYTDSPTLSVAPDAKGGCPDGTNADQKQVKACCPKGWVLSPNTAWCNAPLLQGTGNSVPTFQALAPWQEVQPGIGFSIPIDGQHNQYLSTGQIDFTGVLETYILDYVPWVDTLKSSCVADGVCSTGFKCDTNSHLCVTDDDTIRVEAIEGADFLGDVFLCQDPTTSDILHLHMYDSALSILDWLASHSGSANGNVGVIPSAQTACQIIVRRSPYDNFVTQITSKSNGVSLNVSGGQGQGRVTDVVLFDPGLIQAL
jgi:hypothetical protein